MVDQKMEENAMKIGNVTGVVQVSRQAICLRDQTFLTVDMDGSSIVAADQTGAREGDRVLLTLGMAAGRFSMEAPVDAAVVAILKESSAHPGNRNL